MRKQIFKKVEKFLFKQKLKSFDPNLVERFERVKSFARMVRPSEYHLTNKCNIRCKGCWFFEYEFDQKTNEVSELNQLENFILKEKERGVTAPLLIGGEPSLFPERIKLFRKHMPYVTISSNGLKKLPFIGFEDIAVAVSLFGGGELDDQLRAYGPTGKPFKGLFDRALANYKNDPRVGFVFAVTHEGLNNIEPTVQKIRDNGNFLLFNYYSAYNEEQKLQRKEQEKELLEEVLRVQEKYSDIIITPPYLINALITGQTRWGEFSYETCPSISQDYEGHSERRKNGNPTLPGFNAYAADLETIEFCCTSGHCDGCRDSQAVMSWVLVNFRKFLKNDQSFETWLEIAEAYWKEFPWSPFHKHHLTLRELGKQNKELAIPLHDGKVIYSKQNKIEESFLIKNASR